MRSRVSRSLALGAALLLAASPAPLASQQPGSVTADLIADIGEVEQKLMQLAKAIPEDKFAWRPGTGVRSVAEVFQHVSADNYLLAAPLGAAPPTATGIKPEDYKTVQAYETRKIGRDEILKDLETSFAHLKAAMKATTPATMGQQVKLFGQTFSTQRVMILTATHLHEHLGQLIAYARSNNVTPPWSRGG